MNPIVVRQYARLTTDEVTSNLDQACISKTAFDWLCNLNSNYHKAGASLLQIENRRWLRLDSYVGIVETPCGTQLEIIPKHTEDSSDKAALDARKILIKMLTVALDVTAIGDFCQAASQFMRQAPSISLLCGTTNTH